jgi:hypothetical protein
MAVNDDAINLIAIEVVAANQFWFSWIIGGECIKSRLRQYGVPI